MILSVKERIGAILIMKSLSGDLDNQVITRSIINKCEITPHEAEAINFRRINGEFLWNEQSEKPAEINFTEPEITIFKECFKFLNENKLINQTTLDICLKISTL